jgi:O-antigen/teichoic acid export membrane protein
MNSAANTHDMAQIEPLPLDTSEELPHEEFSRNLGDITRHSAVYLLGTLFTLAMGYLVKLYVARVLGAKLLGMYALGMTVVSFMQLFGSVGLPRTAARYVAVYNATGQMHKLRAFLSKSLVFLVVLNLGFAVGMLWSGKWIAVHFYRVPELGRYMPLFAVLMFLGSLSVFYAQVLAGFKGVAQRTVIANFVGSPVVMVLTVILLAGGMRLWGYLTAHVLGAAVVLALMVAMARRLTPPAARFARGPVPPLQREIVSFSAASFGMNAIAFLSGQADKILLGLYLSARPVGIYVLASTLAAFVPIILQSVNQIFAPVIADLHARNSQETLCRLFQTLTKWILGLTLPLALVVILFAPKLMRIMGPDFQAGWPVLVIAALGQIVNCAVGSAGQLLLMSGHQKQLFKVQAAMAVVSVIANLALIPVLGMVGAAVAAAVVNIGTNVWNLIEVRKELGISPYNRSYLVLVPPVVLAITALLLLHRFTASVARPWVILPAALALSYTIFFGAAALFGLNEDDRVVVSGARQQLSLGLQRLGVRN